MPADIPFEEQESSGMNGNHAGPAGESPPVSSGRPRSRSAIRVDSLRSTMSSGSTRSRKRAGFFGIFGRVGRVWFLIILCSWNVDSGHIEDSGHCEAEHSVAPHRQLIPELWYLVLYFFMAGRRPCHHMVPDKEKSKDVGIER